MSQEKILICFFLISHLQVALQVDYIFVKNKNIYIHLCARGFSLKNLLCICYEYNMLEPALKQLL